MNIKFTGQYKALKSFEWLNVPTLALITGLNGSGKSQLLQILSSSYNYLSQNNSKTNILKSDTYSVEFENVDYVKGGLIEWQSQGGHFSFEQNKFGYKDLEKICEFLINEIHPQVNTKYAHQQNTFHPHSPHSIPENDPNYLPGFNRLLYVLDSKKNRIIEEIIKRTGKPKVDIIPEDILFHLPEEILTEDVDLLNQYNLDMIFFLYLYRKISLENRNENIEILGEAPWDILNKVIKAAGLPYALMKPEEGPIKAVFRNPLNRLNPYQFSAKLIDPDKGTEIGFYNLSSGEKIILSLALLLYYFQHRNLKKSILILDEVDAHLHPSLTKQFFDVIFNVVIKEYGARVLMATHSPSTVALAPINNIFILQKEKESTLIKKVSKDEALNILTSGVPSLSINYENRRQIFVESKYDAEFYDIVYSLIKQHLISEISLNFISSGVSGRGNCDQVKDIVDKLNGFGNKSIFGIIDWDKKNQTAENIKVLGENKRYSIETYIFDPVLMGYYLLRQKFITNQALGLKESDKFLNYARFDQVQLQTITDKILDLIKPNFKKAEEDELQEVEYLNNLKLKMPNWFLKNYGHDLPSIMHKTFPKLQRFQTENDLRKEVILNTIVDIPELISKDLLDLLKSIQI